MYVGRVTPPQESKPHRSFTEFDSVESSFVYLSHTVRELLQKEDYDNLKFTCTKVVTDARLSQQVCSEVQSSGNTNELLSALMLSPYWNWMNIRLMGMVAAISVEATKLLQSYKDYLYPQNLVDLLSFIPAIGKDKESNYKMMSVKMQAKINNVTVKKFYSYRKFLESILNLNEVALVLKRIEKEPFNIEWLIPSDQCSHAYKSAKEGIVKFQEISLVSIHIESFEAIHPVCYGI